MLALLRGGPTARHAALFDWHWVSIRDRCFDINFYRVRGKSNACYDIYINLKTRSQSHKNIMALEHPRLIFSSNSLRHTTLACDSLGIHYEIKETDTGDVGVTRWDKQTNNQVPVGEYSIHIFKSPKIRFPGGDWEALDTFLHKDGWFFTHDRTFTGQGGTKYRWKHKLAGLTLFHVDDDKEPVVHYVRHSMSHEKSYLEILDKTVLDVLDKIVFSFLIMERLHRNSASGAAAASGTTGGGGGGGY